MTDNTGPAFGDEQLWQVIHEQYPGYFSNFKAIQYLQQLKTEMEEVAAPPNQTNLTTLNVIRNLESAARNLVSNYRRNSNYSNIFAWADKNVTNLNNTITKALAQLKGREKELGTIAEIIVAFTNDWTFGKAQYLNFILMGSAGSGKTTLAQYMAKLLQSSGLVFRSSGFVNTTRSDFIGQYLGQSGPKTVALLESAREKVLFIDEAYALAKCAKEGNSVVCTQWDPYSDEAMTALVAFLSQNIGQIIVIAAGYETEMKQSFMAINEGIPRRFPNQIVLAPMSSEKLKEIFVHVLAEKRYWN